MRERLFIARQASEHGIAVAHENRRPEIDVTGRDTGRVAKAEEITQPKYWRNHLREPVRFAAGIQTLAESGCEIFLELGPNPVLLAMGRRCTTKSNTLWLPKACKPKT